MAYPPGCFLFTLFESGPSVHRHASGTLVDDIMRSVYQGIRYSGVPSIVRVCAKRFHPHYSGHPHYMISGLNNAGRRTIHDITSIKHYMGYVQPTRRMTVAQRLCTQQGDRIRCGVSSKMQMPAVVRG